MSHWESSVAAIGLLALTACQPQIAPVPPPVVVPEVAPDVVAPQPPEPVPVIAPGVPRDAYRYQRELTGNARALWGISAPVATFAAQVHQESGWRPDAKSRFAGGLAQFTPSTADWISEAFPDELGANQPFNPSWALRALVRYDKHLHDRINAATGCDRMAFTLSAYNGGAGWITKDRALAAQGGADPGLWWGHVERYSGRAAWAFEENRGYAKRILRVLEPKYKSWGPLSC